MATSDQSQMGQDVNYHKRMAMGASLDGSSLGGKSPAPTRQSAKPRSGSGALAQAKKK